MISGALTNAASVPRWHGAKSHAGEIFRAFLLDLRDVHASLSAAWFEYWHKDDYVSCF